MDKVQGGNATRGLAIPRTFPDISPLLDRVNPPLIVALVAIPLVVARNSAPSLAWDDGPIFQAGASAGIASVIAPYGGYFHPLARSIALLASAAGSWEVAWIGALGVAIFVAAYVASDAMSSVLPEPWQRVAAGVAVLVLPGTVQTLGLLGQIQWYAEIFLLAWILTGSANRLVLALFSLSGPFAILFAPLVLLRRPSGWPIVLAGGAVQIVGLLTSHRGAPIELDRFVDVLVLRGILGSYLGEIDVTRIPVVLALVAAAAGAVLGAVAIVLDRRLWPVFACGAIVAVTGVLFAGETNEQLLHGSGSRYFLALTFGLVLLVVRSPQRPISWAMAALLTVGIARNFTIPVRAFYGWG